MSGACRVRLDTRDLIPTNLLRRADAEAEVHAAGPGRAHAAATARTACTTGTARHHGDQRLDVGAELDGCDAGRVSADRAGDNNRLAGLQLGERHWGQTLKHLLRIHHATPGAALTGRTARCSLTARCRCSTAAGGSLYNDALSA